MGFKNTLPSSKKKKETVKYRCIYICIFRLIIYQIHSMLTTNISCLRVYLGKLREHLLSQINYWMVNTIICKWYNFTSNKGANKYWRQPCQYRVNYQLTIREENGENFEEWKSEIWNMQIRVIFIPTIVSLIIFGVLSISFLILTKRSETSSFNLLVFLNSSSHANKFWM